MKNESQARNSRVGKAYEDFVAKDYETQGFRVVARQWKHPAHVEIDLVMTHPKRGDLWIECKASHPDTAKQRGLRRSDTAKKVLDAAQAIDKYTRTYGGARAPYVCVTTDFYLARSQHAKRLDLAQEQGLLIVRCLPFEYIEHGQATDQQQWKFK